MGRRAARHRLGAARHLHGRPPRWRPGRRPSSRWWRSGPATGVRPTSPPPPARSTSSRRAGCWSTSSPGRTPWRRTATPRATRPTATPAPGSSCSSSGGCGPRRTSPSTASTSRCTGSTVATRPVVRGDRRHPRLYFGGASEAAAAGRRGRGRRAALLGRAAGGRRRADRAPARAQRGAGPRARAAGVRAADHHAGPRHHRARPGPTRRPRSREMADGVGVTPVDQRRSGAVGQQRLLDLAARGDVLDDCLYTAPGRYGGGGAGHHLAGRVGRATWPRRCAGTRTWASPTSSSRTRRTARDRPGGRPAAAAGALSRGSRPC